MTKTLNANQADIYVPKQKTYEKIINGFATLTGAGIITAICLGTATFNQRIDVAKEKMIYGYELTEKEASLENDKIKSSIQAVNYYCNSHSDNPKCSNFNNRYNPLGQVQKVSYEPNLPPLIAIPKTKVKAPNSPFSFQAKKAPQKNLKKHDNIGQIVAENNFKNVIKAKY